MSPITRHSIFSPVLVIALLVGTRLLGSQSIGIGCGEITPVITIHWVDKRTNEPITNVEIHACSRQCEFRNLESKIQNPEIDQRHVIFYSTDHFYSNSAGVSSIKISIPASGSTYSDGHPEPMRAYDDPKIFYRVGTGTWHSIAIGHIPGVEILGKTEEEISRSGGTVVIDHDAH